jgi:hypothetical protein
MLAPRKSSASRKVWRVFDSFRDALAWAKRHADDSCLPYQGWNVVELGDQQFAVVVKSRNTGYFSHYAE